MVKRIDLNETPSKRMARILRGETDAINSLLTHGAGIKHLGLNGDVRWRGTGWQPDPDNPTGPPIPTTTWQTWSVKDVAREAVVSRLAAEGAVASANGKNARIYSLDPAFGQHNPSTGGLLVDGDTWWQYADDDGNYLIVGSWVLIDGQWVEETLSDAVLGALDVNKLVVLGTADINELVAQAIAAKIMEAELFRTPVNPETGFWAVMDSFGFRVINEYGPDGDRLDVIRLGPDADQWLQIGTPETGMATIDSGGGVTAVHGSFSEVWIDGKPISTGVGDNPRGLVAYGRMFDGRSRRLNGRDIVLGVDVNLPAGRVYKIETSSVICETETGSCTPFLQLHTSLGAETPPWNNWAGTCRKESLIGPYGGFRALPGMSHMIDLTHLDPGDPDTYARLILSLGNFNNNGWVQAAAVVDNIWLTVEDVGNHFTNLGNPWFDTAGSTPPPPPKVRQTIRFHPYEWGTWMRGGARDLTEKPTQGQWSQWNRSCYFFFPDMVGPLAGAEIHRITLFSWADHWGLSSGTGRWHWHGLTSPPAQDLYLSAMVDTPGWPAGAARTLDIHPANFGAWQNGQARGYGFTTADTSHEFYGQFSPLHSAHFIDVEFSR